MASPESIASGGTGNTGTLAVDNVFYVQTGTIMLSTDGGTTQIPFYQGERVIFSAGLQVDWENQIADTVILYYMPI